jgi:hypothetical protein
VSAHARRADPSADSAAAAVACEPGLPAGTSRFELLKRRAAEIKAGEDEVQR